MAVDPGWDKDPLRPKTHRVLMESPTEPGKWMVVSVSQEPIEMLRLIVARDHAIGMQSCNIVIVDEGQTVEERLENYVAIPQDKDEPITPENQKTRDRWIANVIRWLLPSSLWNASNTEENQLAVKQCLDEQKVELAINPMGTQVLLMRDGATLTAWSV